MAINNSTVVWRNSNYSPLRDQELGQLSTSFTFVHCHNLYRSRLNPRLLKVSYRTFADVAGFSLEITQEDVLTFIVDAAFKIVIPQRAAVKLFYAWLSVYLSIDLFVSPYVYLFMYVYMHMYAYVCVYL